MIELLSPAGDFERLKFALRYGADAVYIGGKNYSLRANAINFTNEETKEATKFAHSLNKKVYVTVNIVLHDENIDGLKEYLLFSNYYAANSTTKKGAIGSYATLDEIKEYINKLV